MNAHIIYDGKNTFRRISKRTARRIWGLGSKTTIALCTVKPLPGYPWGHHCTVFPEQQAADSFDRAVDAFEYFYCIGNEYTAFYIVQ